MEVLRGGRSEAHRAFKQVSGSSSERKPAVTAVCFDRAFGLKALRYGMRFSCFTDRDLCGR